MQQVLAYESDLLEYPDLFEGSVVVAEKTAALVAGAREELERVQAMGGAVAAVESGYMKSALVGAHAARRGRVESGEDAVIGVNMFTSTEPNPLLADLDTAIQVIDPHVEQAAADAVREWRAGRDEARATAARAVLAEAAAGTGSLMPASLECARAGVTVGEWSQTLQGRVRRVPGAHGCVRGVRLRGRQRGAGGRA